MRVWALHSEDEAKEHREFVIKRFTELGRSRVESMLHMGALPQIWEAIAYAWLEETKA